MSTPVGVPTAAWSRGPQSRAERACVAAGLSPELQTLEQLRNIKRPTQIPDAGLTCDLLWSDPDPDAKGWGESDRGVSFTFGADVVAKFLQRTDLDLVCRAHQVRTISAVAGKQKRHRPGHRAVLVEECPA